MKNKTISEKLKSFLNSILQLLAFASGLYGIFIFLTKDEIHLATYSIALGTFLYLVSQEYNPVIQISFTDEKSVKGK